ncbi:putative nitrogen fixation protein [Fontibacillus phaseoli]|uniref:Putative nitrogen fixation protein n=1 Tax=Fontibacillus phaseoli TaxID=1416533 RepID=A0A369BJ19_9BACL|nr:DUF269 domain-containing protein [Fontibacillus phaseoli]RCX21589.1 putative nitrogen fixation protein [Fontibacillus phaseoli]
MAEQACNLEQASVEQDLNTAGNGHAGSGKWDEERLGEIFISSLDRCLQLLDPWGKYENCTPEQRMKQLYLCSPEQKREIAGDCRVSPVVKTQVPLFFQAVAAALEQLSGNLIQSMIEVNEEGFGRALVYSGRTVLVADSFRGGVPFPFAEVEKVLVYGVSCIREGLQNRERFMQRTPFS